MTEESQEVQVEVMTWGQAMQEMLSPGSIQGTPVGTAYVVPKREQKPGQELSRHRVRVSFDFDVTCNDGPVRNMSYDEGGTMSIALLKSFLTADRDKLLMLMVDQIGSKLGYHPDAFMEDFLPQVNVEPHELFKPAIDVLEGDEGVFWRETRDLPPEPKYGDMLSLYTEEIFACFEALFVSSSYEVVEEHE